MKKIFCLIVLVFCGITGFSQISISDKTREALQGLPQENIFVHLSSSLGLPGETLYYRLYNLNNETEKLSEISEIVYISLIDKKGEAVFSHKLNLKNGLGAGDFFIPSEIESGNYKFIAYTQWMKNAGGNHLFRANFSIINPYRDLPANTTKLSEETGENQNIERQDKTLTLELENTTFSTRKKVIASLENPESLEGKFSVSVRKKDKLARSTIPDAVNYEDIYSKTAIKNLNNPVFLPELRGHLISGQINAGTGSAQNKNVALSIPGNQSVFKIASTDNNGRFFFNLDKNHSAEDAFLQVLNPEGDRYEIVLGQKTIPDISNLDFTNFTWNNNVEALEKRSIHNQIENAYFEISRDSLKLPEFADEIFEEMNPEVFDLDDYTRFDSVEETFIEIINSGRIRTNDEGERVILIRNRENGTDYNLPPLLVIDEIIEQNHQEFISYPSRDIQKIEIYRDNLFLGPHVAQGMIKVTTKEGNYHQNLSSEITKTEIARTQPKKNYIFRDYNVNTQQRTPDYRHQLYWNPNLEIEGDNKNLEFFTSDVTGEFEINIQGFTDDGRPVSIIQTFKVE